MAAGRGQPPAYKKKKKKKKKKNPILKCAKTAGCGHYGGDRQAYFRQAVV
jgi:hypothetical protein